MEGSARAIGDRDSMAAATCVSRLVADIQACVDELKNEYQNSMTPITDDSRHLHRFCNKLEYVLQNRLKEKHSLLGSYRDYWDYICKCLASTRGIHDGIKFVKSVREFKTSLGRGRAFIRFCLVHQCLADTLQQCFQNGRVTSDFYHETSLLLDFENTTSLVSSLYELNDIVFDFCLHGYDLDVAWPTFARRDLQSPGSWAVPSRTVSMSSLVSISSQQNSHQFLEQSNVTSEEQERSASQLSDISITVGDLLAKMQELKSEQLEANDLIKKSHLQIETCFSKNGRKELISGTSSSCETDDGSCCDVAKSDANIKKCTINSENAASQQGLEREESLPRVAEIAPTEKSMEVFENETMQDNVVGRCLLCDTMANKLLGCHKREEQLDTELTYVKSENVCLLDQLEKWKQLMAGYAEKLAIQVRVNEHLANQVKAMREASDALHEMLQLRTSECTSLKALVQELKSAQNVAVVDRLHCLENENSLLVEKVEELTNKLNCEVQRQEQSVETAVPTANSESVSEVHTSVSSADSFSEELRLAANENEILNMRLETFQKWLCKVERAEAELEELECTVTEERDDVEFASEREIGEVTCLPPEDASLISVVQKTLRRLHTLIADKKVLQAELLSSKEINDNLISKVQEQEEKLTTVTIELSEAKVLVDSLKKAFEKLQTSEAVLRYELKEKRTVVDRLRQQLECSRAQWARIRQKHSESELEWQSLRSDFAGRYKQESEESGYVDDKCSDSPPVCLANRPSPSVLTESACLGAASLSSDFNVSSGEKCDETDGSVTSRSESPSCSSSASQTKSRLQQMEEQCHLLYSQLVASRKKSELLEWKLAQIHERHSQSRDEHEDVVASGGRAEADVEEDEKEEEQEEEEEEPIQDINANFDVTFNSSLVDDDCSSEPLPGEEEHCNSLLVSVVAEQLEHSDFASTEEEDDVSENRSLSGSRDLHRKPTGNVKSRQFPEALVLAQALPKRIEKLKREKEDLEKNLCRLQEDQTVSGAREADLRADLQQVQSVLAKREAEVSTLQSSRAELLRRETEFKQRVGLVMRKERDKTEAKYQTVVAVKEELQSKVELFEEQVQERQEEIEHLREDVRLLQEELESSKCSLEQEVLSLKFQLSSETMRCEQAVSKYAQHEEDIKTLRNRLSEQEQLITSLEEELFTIRQSREVEKEQQKLEVEDLQLRLNTREEECTALIDELKEVTRSLDHERRMCQHLSSVSEDAKTENQLLKERFAEARKDNVDLQKKIIKLIREKDMLWKHSEHLSFQQKIQATDRWLNDDETSHCLACRAEFTLVLRKHHCRLCGRIFCHNCCNHWAMTTSSSRRVRVCNECIIRHSHIDVTSVSLNDSDEDEDSASACLPNQRHIPDDTSDMTSPLCVAGQSSSSSVDCDLVSGEQSTSCGGDGAALPTVEANATNSHKMQREGSSSLLGRIFTRWNSSSKINEISTSHLYDEEDFCVITDEEIMKSLSSSSPYWPLASENGDPSVHLCSVQTVDDIVKEFERGLPREVWVNAGKTYAIPILITEKTTLTWAFTTEPKSIAFTLTLHYCAREPNTVVVSRETQTSFSPATEVLIPTTHCDSHLHPVHGKLIAKKPGIHTFYFDNTFSRFTAKKVKIILRVHKDESSEMQESRGTAVNPEQVQSQ